MTPRRRGTAPRRAVVAVYRRQEAGGASRPDRLIVVRESACPRVTVRRLPGGGRPAPGKVVDEHVNAELVAGSPWTERADILMLGCAHRPDTAVRVAGEMLARFPGCLVAAVPTTGGGCVATARDGQCVAVAPAAGQRPPTADELAVAVSCLHAELVLGGSWAGVRAICLSAPAGPRAPQGGQVRLRPHPAPPAGAPPGDRLPA
ncbi:hypothetical protein [Streptomyces sp. NPDC087270]|uniref:hypothetical protein n=1 Tax=Streptomyces sp. NPDC087270 TaxID=3365774 RepID=UPI0037F3CF18